MRLFLDPLQLGVDRECPAFEVNGTPRQPVRFSLAETEGQCYRELRAQTVITGPAQESSRLVDIPWLDHHALTTRRVGQRGDVSHERSPPYRVVERGPQHHAAVVGRVGRETEVEARGDELLHVARLELRERDRAEERDEVYSYDLLVEAVGLRPEPGTHGIEPLVEELSDGRTLIDNREPALEICHQASQLFQHLPARPAVDRLAHALAVDSPEIDLGFPAAILTFVD